ncbi:hypothetical protein SLOPH_1038 [Spraguea lophii 42_110]|uniref:Uncharacterized protein n=1 Tax=Spraguea lophii (strain 42_110) TaxID=1358809 RepID=S7W7B0_SPRLO|nr:hypothetical protein SLOPH_1038 [Spraguea lophii 42_110]
MIINKFLITCLKILIIISAHTCTLILSRSSNNLKIFFKSSWLYLIPLTFIVLLNFYILENLYTPRKERRFVKKKIHTICIAILETMTSVYITLARCTWPYMILVILITLPTIACATYYLVRKKIPQNKITMVDDELFRVVYLRRPYKIDGDIKINKGEIAQVISEEENTLIVRKFNGEDFRVNKEDICDNMDGIIV